MVKLLVTEKDMKRYEVLKDVVDKKLAGLDAANLLGLTNVHISRLKKKFQEGGFEAILRKVPSNPPNSKISEEVMNEIIKLRKEIYYDFNINHFNDKLHERHNITYSYSSIKNILISRGLHTPRRKKIAHRQRRRMPKAGMLVQMDSSQHQWLEHIPEKWWLIAMIDDATNEVPYARFFHKDTLFANMQVIRRFIELKGIFMSLYADKASHFKTTRHGGLHVKVGPEQDDTQIESALDELGITLIPANSPQAKGRIEVTFRLFQDRLVKEMRLANISDYNEANKFLIEKFLPWYNNRFSHKTEESVYRPILNGISLDIIFSIKKERIVNNDNTVSFNGQIIQIPPSNRRLSFTKARVDVCLLEDERIFVVYKDNIIAEAILSRDSKTVKKEKNIDELLNQREYIPIKIPKKKYIPSVGHPWRKSFAKWIRLSEEAKTAKKLVYRKTN